MFQTVKYVKSIVIIIKKFFEFIFLKDKKTGLTNYYVANFISRLQF